MSVSRRAPIAFPSSTWIGLGVVVIALTYAMTSPAYAATLGHSRVLSKPGDALAIDVQIKDITAADRSSLTVGIAPLHDWTQAGLTPPVPLDALRVALAQGPQAASSVIQIRSDRRFNGAVADLLLDVGSAAGIQRHQVSLLMPSTSPARLPASSALSRQASSTVDAAAHTSIAGSENNIAVRRGDNLFVLSRRHVPPGISIYQWMIAVHQANPHAFIRGNINLVKAGANLSIPDTTAMAALSDKQARSLFRDLAGSILDADSRLALATPVSATDAAASGQVSSSSSATEPQPDANQDRLRLTVAGDQASTGQKRGVLSDTDAPAGTSSASNTGSDSAAKRAGDSVADRQPSNASDDAPGHDNRSMADDRPVDDNELAVRKELAETGGRVSQLENNIKNLNQAMQAQGLAATTLVEESANEIGQTLSGAGKALVDASAGAEAILAVPADIAPTKTNKVDKTVLWLQNNLLAIVTILLALLVLVLAWALRRASGARAQGRDGSGGVITEAMVKEKLDQINFDLAAEDKPVVRTRKD